MRWGLDWDLQTSMWSHLHWHVREHVSAGCAESMRRRSLGSAGNSDEDDSDSEPHSSAAAQVGHTWHCT